MLHLIPRSVHRAGYRVAHRLRKLWWRMRRPIMHGVSIIARNQDGALLLVRASYGAQLWQFPGGGVEHGEDPCIAAMREFHEETGLALRDPQLLGQQVEKLHGATNIVHVVTGHGSGEPEVDGREIVAAHWFDAAALPEDRSGTVDHRLGTLQQR